MSKLKLLPAIFALTATLLSAPVAAHHDQVTIGNITIDHTWSRQTPPGAGVAAGFMRITNNGTESDFLVGGTVVNAKRFEVHEMVMDGGMMKMRELADGLKIEPGATVELRPGSYHVMFMEIQNPVKAGDTLEGTLVFKNAGKVEVKYRINPVGARTYSGEAAAPQAGAGSATDAHAAHGSGNHGGSSGASAHGKKH